jgi:hypothetical protein
MHSLYRCLRTSYGWDMELILVIRCKENKGEDCPWGMTTLWLPVLPRSFGVQHLSSVHSLGLWGGGRGDSFVYITDQKHRMVVWSHP